MAPHQLTPEERRVLQDHLLQSRAVVCIEGNIGAGKSVVNKELAGRGFSCANEPVESWTLLPSFYQDPGRYGFALQCQIWASYATMGADGTLISERGPDASLHVCARMLHTSGEITVHNFESLQRVYNATPFVLPQIIVYLDAPPELCMERIARRGRRCENAVTLDYITQLGRHYQDFLRLMQARGVRVVRIPCEEFDQKSKELADAIECVLFQACIGEEKK